MKVNFSIISFLAIIMLTGCTEDEPVAPTPVQEISNQTLSKTVSVGNIEREYVLYVPDSYDGNTAVPLLFNFHGFTQSAIIQLNSIGDMRPIADTANFILAYPQGSLFNSNAHWNVGSWTEGSTANDIGFTDTMIEAISAEYNIDQSRIYVCGFSNGGFFSFELACQSSKSIAAIGTVAATMSEKTFNACDPTRPIPMVTIHGTADNVVNYNGIFPVATVSHNEILTYWANHNNTDNIPSITNLSNINASEIEVELYEYLEGDSGTEIKHYRFISAGHIWPVSNVNPEKDASKIIWNFVSKFNINGLIE